MIFAQAARFQQKCLRLSTAVSTALQRTPLTLRSILLLLFCGYLLLGPVPYSSDIVAASLAYGLLTLLGIIAAATLIEALYIKKRLTLELHPPEELSVSGQSARCLVVLSRVSLLPGTVLTCRPSFVHPEISVPTIKLFKGTQPGQRLAIDCIPPHRGNWDVHGIHCTVGDLTGFMKVSWRVALDTSLIVTPPSQPDTLLPLVSSTQRAGDLVPDAVHRLGDPFDIKPYHPSDGVKKIVWKAFAKSGELLSRHAEASMTPEGFVALFVLARPEDDDVCGKALAYVHALTELKLDLLLSCEGQNGRAPGHNVESCQELLIDATWDAKSSNTRSACDDLQALFDACTRTGIAVNLRKVIVFCSGSRLASTTGPDLMRAIAQWMEERSIEPVFFLTQPQITPDSERRVWSRLAGRVLYESTTQGSIPPTAEEYQRFLSTCLSKQWEVFI